MKNDMRAWQQHSYLSAGNAYLETLYDQYLKDPEAIEPHWSDYFRSLPKVNGLDTLDVSLLDIESAFRKISQIPRRPQLAVTEGLQALKQAKVDDLIDAYRHYGHLIAKLDPLGLARPKQTILDLGHYTLSKADLNTTFKTPKSLGDSPQKLSEILRALENVYCQTLGIEYMYIMNQQEREWIQHQLEQMRGKPRFSVEEKQTILRHLIAADTLEKYLGSKYPGQKRFSPEGADSVIPMIDLLIVEATRQNVAEVVMGMAHRGRLSVLVNLIGQSPAELFQEFEGKKDYGLTSGDVKYHLGFSSDRQTPHGNIHLSLAFNPSHLEIISPVVIGSVRARQEVSKDEDQTKVIPLILHGDAAFSAQGVVMETLAMSQTRAEGVGGTIHIVVNNQIGFTTSNSHDARSSEYCTDIAKMINAPVFHVNGDDPEMAVFVAKMALNYRLRFKKDVVIDLVCYRRHGHQEADEPSITQPLMYHKIEEHPTPPEIYAEKLIKESVVDDGKVQQMKDDYRDALDAGHRVVETISNGLRYKREVNWTPYIDQNWNIIADTSINKEHLLALAKKLEEYPSDFEFQRQVGFYMTARAKMTSGAQPVDWGYAETLAYATLLDTGFRVRIVGEDSRRGTFAHRHAVLHDYNTGKEFTPLNQVVRHSGDFQVYDSLLSEEAALAFEYGYAKTDPETLVIWEAQFGDFANGAQVVIDQFISSGWQKWKRLCGLVMFLPHGYEGMGPEHSSGRLERYLQLCAQNNIQVSVPTTPAQIFHLLRRQMIRPFRKPLIVMTPKSLLRHKLAVSTIDELATGRFQLIIPEIDNIKPKRVKRIILCTGKVYYDLLTKRREEKINDTAILRIEQLYPFPLDELKEALSLYPNTKEIVWCQEEPKNQGTWFSKEHYLRECLQKGQTLRYAGRLASAAPAAGYPALHKKQQEEFVNDAFQIG